MMPGEIPHAAVFNGDIVQSEPDRYGPVLGHLEIIVVLMPPDLTTGVGRLVYPLVMDQTDVRSDQTFDHIKQPRIVDQHAKDRVPQVGRANLVDLKVLVTIRARLNILENLLPLQPIDGFHVTGPEVIQLVQVEKTVRKDETVLEKGIDLFLFKSQRLTSECRQLKIMAFRVGLHGSQPVRVLGQTPAGCGIVGLEQCS